MPNVSLRLVVTTAIATSLAVTAAAPAKIVGYPRAYSAAPVAKSIVRKPDLLRKSVFAILPPSATPAAVSTTKLGGFPRNGTSYGILSTGNAKIAGRKNTEGDSGSTSGGLAVRGARDVVIMRIGFVVPKAHNCMTFNFRFLSEEYPEFVDDIFNDTFIAELDRSNWRSNRNDPGINAPRNFAIDREGNPIRVN
ncbi:MAG: choice-of-anchor L domain-containing protein, partial [Solirubrobacteraceae bacterium]